jgi:hypothetical protein
MRRSAGGTIRRPEKLVLAIPSPRAVVLTSLASALGCAWQRMMNHPCSSLFRLPSKICLVTGSTFVRGVVHGMDTPELNPFSGQYQVFTKDQILDALRALDASPVEQREAVALVDQLQKTLGKS